MSFHSSFVEHPCSIIQMSMFDVPKYDDFDAGKGLCSGRYPNDDANLLLVISDEI